METKKKIFIVDDDMTIHEALTAVLSSNEFDIIHAYGGHGVVERTENEQPYLVILDIMMPDRDGRDICKELKMNPKTKDIIILMLSAKNEDFDKKLGFELGADDYETKPFSPPYLATKIKKMCGIK